MAAFNDDVTVGGAEYVELTDSDCTNFTAQGKGTGYVCLIASTGSQPATDAGGAIMLASGSILSGAIADLWPGITGADRVFCKSVLGDSISVMVSHD